MERDRPDRQRGYAVGFKVGLLLALSSSFSTLAWDYVDEFFYLKGASSYYTLLTLSCTVASVAGAVLGSNLAKNWGSLRKVAALGTLLDVAILMYWFNLDKKVIADAAYAYTTADLIWAYFCGVTYSVG